MRVEHTIIFKIDELSEKAQRKAWEKSLEHFDMPWDDENQQSLIAFCERFPVDAKNWCYGDRADITPVMNYDEVHADMWWRDGLRLRTWLLNNHGHVLCAGKYINKTYGILPRHHRWRRSKALIEESCCPLTSYCKDENLLDPIRAFIKVPDNRTLEDLLGECLWSWVNACQKDYEYQTSFECFLEDARANEWEFNKHGKMV